MRGSAAVIVLTCTLFGLASACGIEEKGAAPTNADGGAGKDGGQNVTTDTCFVGAKACPDDKGGLLCVSGNDPASGCKSSTACAPCVLPHAVAKCSDPKGCDIESCETGWSDCNAEPGDGCETSLSKDPLNCGACGTNCFVTSGPNFVCQAGSCVPNDCQPPTTANCDGDPTNGCEIDLTTDVKNCGFCTNTCNLPHAQSGCEAVPSGTPIARCVVKQCDQGWADCDQNPANGCESSASTDPSSCGGCGKKCNQTNGVAGCVNGVCSLLCNPGFGNCDGNPDNGCEVDLGAHVSNCGSCGNACPSANGTPTCQAGKCATGGCSTGYADCDGNPANGCETGTTADPNNCSACGKVCPGTANGFATCAASNCDVGCSPGFSTCGGGSTCFKITDDPTHCGASCKACPGPVGGNGAPTCANGNCGISCNPPLSPCGNACVDLQNATNNCGVCGKVCTAGAGGTATCVKGQCEASCPPNVAECNNQCVDVYNDNGNCGQCGKKCGLGQKCVNGNCQCYAGKNCGSYCAECCQQSDCSPKKCCLNAFCCWL